MVKNKDRWSALSMTERADLINTYIQNGVLKLNEMKEHYNSFGNGGDTWEKVDKFVEKAEPWVSGTSLAATGTALAVSAASGGTAAPVALPVAATIGTISNGAGVLIDGYQSARALMEGDYKKALGNGIEAVLGSFGGKYAAKLAKTTGGRAIGKFKEELVRERFANSGEKITRLMRKGLTYEKAAEQVFKNAVNYVDNSSKVKDVVTSIQDARNKKFEKAAQIADTVFDVKDTGAGIYNSFKEEHPVEIYKCGGKLNSFGDGGETNNNENTKGYTTANNKELQNLETFNSNWYKYRDSQLANVVKSDHSPHHITRGLNFWQTSFPMFVDDTKLANGARNYMEERLKYLKEFTLEEAVKDRQAKQVLIEDYYKYLPSERKENEVEIGPPKSPDNRSLIRLQELLHKGGYSRPTHIAIYSNGHENTSTKIHERAHAAIPKSIISYHPILSPIKTTVLQKDVIKDNYYDDIGEIYSRLMQMRFENRIDPSHKYTLEEVKKMREDKSFKDFHIFDRYTDESILMLLNDVAQNTIDSNKLDYINPANIAANGGKLNSNALGGPLYNKRNPIESFSSSSKIPVVRKRTNSLSDGGPTNEGGWPEATLNKRKKKYNRYDPTGGLGIDQLAYWFFGGNQSKGDENEYWKAYLGLDNNVPKMKSTSKTEWDDQIEAEKIVKGELPSDFYGTTDNMDLYIQAMADTTTTGQIVRNYDEFKTLNPTLASKEEIEAMYKSGKAMMDNPNKWTQVGEKKREAQLDIEDKLVNNEQYPLGMLAAFGAKWLPEENTIHIHDTYDFPKLNSFLGRIPERPKEMKIRGKVKYNPKNRAKLFNSDNFNLKFPK